MINETRENETTYTIGLHNRTPLCINGIFSKEKTVVCAGDPPGSVPWAPTISHIHKRFAISNVFFW